MKEISETTDFNSPGTDEIWKKKGFLSYNTFKLPVKVAQFEASFFPHLPQPTKYLGCGRRGQVFLTTDPNIVLKSSADKIEEELYFAQRENPELLNYTAKIHYILKLGRKTMLIWKERVSTKNVNTKTGREIFDEFKNKFYDFIIDNNYSFWDTHMYNWGFRYSDNTPVFFDL